MVSALHRAMDRFIPVLSDWGREAGVNRQWWFWPVASCDYENVEAPALVAGAGL